ncbi:hypothetical protein HD806DRAFT_427365 [Xylariaceae sp. AK1471]|nr:hypothetical protein HD806DRAFT_427365 [Xylariaceae sp. AK1471]
MKTEGENFFSNPSALHLRFASIPVPPTPNHISAKLYVLLLIPSVANSSLEGDPCSSQPSFECKESPRPRPRLRRRFARQQFIIFIFVLATVTWQRNYLPRRCQSRRLFLLFIIFFFFLFIRLHLGY